LAEGRYLYECIIWKLYVRIGQELNICLMRTQDVRGMIYMRKHAIVDAGLWCICSRLKRLQIYGQDGCFTSGGREVRILVADNDARVRSALKTLLKQEPGLVIAECSDLESLVVQVKEFKPDLVLLDWVLQGRPATALLFAAHAADPWPKMIVLSGRPESEQAALAAGADAFVCKADPPERLLSTLHKLVHES
jgi:CheY-like chemotaxis protein